MPAVTWPTGDSATACRGSSSMATTCWRWCARSRAPPSGRAGAMDRPSWSSKPLPCGGPRRRPAPRSAAAEADAKELRYLDAISDGLREAMRRDGRVVLMGQDIAEYGGVFKVTEGFVEEFGKARVRNTPIIESGAVGAALGLALGGFVPMVEMQFGDFITCGFNQIVNNLAKTHYRSGTAVQVVVRWPMGG